MVGAGISQANDIGLPAASCFGAAWPAIERCFQLPQGCRRWALDRGQLDKGFPVTARALNPQCGALPIAIAMVADG